MGLSQAVPLLSRESLGTRLSSPVCDDSCIYRYTSFLILVADIPVGKHPNDNTIESDHQMSDIVESEQLETDITTCVTLLKLTVLLSVMHVNHAYPFLCNTSKKDTVIWLLRCKHYMAIASSQAGQD